MRFKVPRHQPLPTESRDTVLLSSNHISDSLAIGIMGVRNSMKGQSVTRDVERKREGRPDATVSELIFTQGVYAQKLM